jgi:DNA-binding transcriptional regulator YhcF (GntR family)
MVPESVNPQADPRKYVQLAGTLRGRILDGTLRPGESMPSINALAAEHGWARQTCSKAFRLLEAEGFLFRMRGLGYFVHDPIGMVVGTAHQLPMLRVTDRSGAVGSAEEA